jgi:hypothetical protein
MNDNRNHLGPNWNGQSPRTMADAFPRSASWPKRTQHKRNATLGLIVAAYFVGAVLGYIVGRLA